MQLRTIMREGFLFAVRTDATVADATRTMSEKNVGIVVVLSGNRLVGVFSERDAVRRVLAKGLDPTSTPIDQVMTSDVVVADEGDDSHAAMRRMDAAHIRHLPVCRGTQVVSMLSIRDLLRVGLSRGGGRPPGQPAPPYTVPSDLARPR
jgi:CBS domain-containing protein